MHPVSSVVKTPFRLLRLLRLCYASCYALNHQNPTVLPSLLRLLRLLRLQTAPPGGRKILSPSLRCVWSSWALWPLITGRAVLLSGNPDLSGPTAPQDSSSVRNVETESGLIRTYPDLSGPSRAPQRFPDRPFFGTLSPAFVGPPRSCRREEADRRNYHSASVSITQTTYREAIVSYGQTDSWRAWEATIEVPRNLGWGLRCPSRPLRSFAPNRRIKPNQGTLR